MGARLLLFGQDESQDLLLRIHRAGQLRQPARYHVPRRLARSGLILQFRHGGAEWIVLDSRHPGSEALRSTLVDLHGEPPGRTTINSPASEHCIDLDSPLSHPNPHVFAVLHHIVQNEGVTLKELRVNAHLTGPQARSA